MAVAEGIPDELFWRLTPRELDEFLKRRYEQERRATLRAGLVAAAVYNVNLKKGARRIRPSDFIRERARPQDFMDVATAKRTLDRWAARMNVAHGRKERK